MSDELINALRRIAKVSYGATIEEAKEVSKTQRDAAALIEQQAAALEAANARIAELEAAAKAEPVQAVTTNVKAASQYFRAGRGHGLQEALYACKREHLEEPANTADDIAYTNAIDDCIKAIGRLLSSYPTAALAQPLEAQADARDERLLTLYEVLMQQNIETSSESYLSLKCVGVPPTEDEFATAVQQTIDAALSQKAGEQQ